MTSATLSSNILHSSITNHQPIVTNDDENKESITLLWFDPNIRSNEAAKRTKERLRQINNYVVIHTELELCLTFIRSVDKEKIFLITSDSSASQLLPQIVKLRQIDVIFIFSTEKANYENLTVEFSKIIGIYTDFDSLCASIREEIDLIDNQLQTFSFFDKSKETANNLSRESTEFLWFQLFSLIILRLPRNQQGQQQIIHTCRQYYRDNPREMNLINLFEREYRSEEAIHWYLKQSFVYKLMNKALGGEDIDQLYNFSFLISDLTENLAREHQKILDSAEQILTVYRGSKITKKELKKLRENEGILISMNGYCCTSRLRSSALTLAMKSTKRTDIVPVLFEIECNIRELGKNVVFADVAQYSEYPGGKQVLFDVNAAFRLNSIQHHAQIWLVKMSASSDGQVITRNYIEEKRRETEEKSVAIIFGRLMCNLGQYDKAQQYFERLLADPKGEDLAWAEFNLGRTFDFKGEWEIAQGYYDHAYNRMMNTKPARLKELAYMLNKLGIIRHEQGKYDETLDYYQRALKMEQEFFSSDCINIARILNNIALILNIQGNYNEALDYYRRALDMLKKLSISDHVDIARILNNIGNILYQTGNYDEAVEHYQQALKMQQKLNPSGRIDTAQILTNIGLILNMQGKYDEALGLCQHALKMQQKLYPSGHTDIAGSHNNIGLILYDRGKYDEALHYHEQALKIRKKFYPSGHADIARSLNNIGNILYQQSKYNEALDYYLLTLAMQEKFYSSGHVDIALCLNNIGCTLDRQGKYNEAFHYHQHALKMQQKLYPTGHIDLAYSLNNIGNILYQQEKYNEALDYHHRALQMREKFYPLGHADIGDSLNNIGITYEHIQKAKTSLVYFQRALLVYEKFLPIGHPNIETVRGNIHRITVKK